MKPPTYFLSLFGIFSAFLQFPAVADAEPGMPSWIRSDRDTGIKWLSRIPDANLSVQAADGNAVLDRNSLEKAGWLVKRDGFLESPPQAGGERLDFTLTGLLPGEHDVYLRYFSKPRDVGETWWYISYGHIKDKMVDLSYGTPGRRIVAGMAGQDPATVFEVKLGTFGSKEAPTTDLSFGISRYRWSQIARFGPIRIETRPNPLAPSALPAETRREILSHMQKAPSGKDKFAHWGVVSSMAKIRPAFLQSIQNHAVNSSISLVAAQGETESAQIVFHSDHPLRLQNLSVSNLTRIDAANSAMTSGDGSSTISSNHLILAPLGFVIEKSTDELQRFGYWPDPIMTHLAEFTTQPGLLHALWFRVQVPQNTLPGTYEGTVAMSLNDQSLSIPVSLRVLDFQLPEWSHMPFVAGGAGAPGSNINQHFLSYGILPGSIYGYPSGDPQKTFAEWSKLRAPMYGIGYLPGGSPGTWPGRFPDFKVPQKQLDAWAKEIQSRLDAAKAEGMTGTPYVYLWDEAEKEWSKAFKQTADMIREQFPGMFIITTAHIPELGEQKSSYDAWVALTSKLGTYETTPNPSKDGAELWIYVCNSPTLPFDNVFVSSKGSATRRLPGWIAHSLRASGFLYYHFSLNSSSQPILGSDVFTDWRVIADGDGDFLQMGPKGPLPSQRMELLRDGLEDFDYIYIASQELQRLSEFELSDNMRKRVENVKRILQPTRTHLKDTTPESERIRRDLSERLELGEFIEKARAITQ